MEKDIFDSLPDIDFTSIFGDKRETANALDEALRKVASDSLDTASEQQNNVEEGSEQESFAPDSVQLHGADNTAISSTDNVLFTWPDGDEQYFVVETPDSLSVKKGVTTSNADVRFVDFDDFEVSHRVLMMFKLELLNGVKDVSCPNCRREIWG